MAWGAAATGTPSATGSTGQGLSLMQESFAELTLAAAPARGLQHGARPGRLLPGHARRRPRRLPRIVLAPMDVPEAVELTQLAFHLADKWRNPVLLYGDYYLAHTSHVGRRSTPLDFGPLPADDWALDGSTSGTGHAAPRVAARHHQAAATTRRLRPRRALHRVRATHRGDARRHRAAGRDRLPRRRRRRRGRVRHARRSSCATRCTQLRADGERVGYVRPITLLPFPYERGRARRRRRRGVVAVYENNQGQMVDDVRLARAGAAPVEFIGGLSLDGSGFGIAPDLDSRDTCASRDPRRCSMERLDDRSLPPHRRAADASRRAWSTTSRPTLLDVSEHQPVPGLRRADRDARRSSRRSRSSALRRSAPSRVIGIGCYTAFSNNLDVEVLQALHGRAPSVATGVKRAQARHARVHAPGRRRHGERGPAGGAAHRGARRERHLHPARTTACSARPAGT